MTEHLTDALASLGATETTFRQGVVRTRIDYFLMSREWVATDGEVVDTSASDHRPIWVDVRPAAGTTTTATTRGSD